jgi:hypothetical protein
MKAAHGGDLINIINVRPFAAKLIVHDQYILGLGTFLAPLLEMKK